MPSRDRVRFNLTGRNFEVSSDTYDKLERLSVKSKLMIEESRMCDPKGEVFLERDPACFAALVRFCQQGKLHLPTAVCPQVFQDEMTCWGVELSELENCCYNTMVSFLEDRIVVDKFESGFVHTRPTGPATKMTSRQSLRHRVWNILDRPSSSRLAKAYFLVSLTFLGMSLFSMVVSTHPAFRRDMDMAEWREALGNDFENYKGFLKERFGWRGDTDYDADTLGHNVSKRSANEDAVHSDRNSVVAMTTKGKETPLRTSLRGPFEKRPAKPEGEREWEVQKAPHMESGFQDSDQGSVVLPREAAENGLGSASGSPRYAGFIDSGMFAARKAQEVLIENVNLYEATLTASRSKTGDSIFRKPSPESGRNDDMKTTIQETPRDYSSSKGKPADRGEELKVNYARRKRGAPRPASTDGTTTQSLGSLQQNDTATDRAVNTSHSNENAETNGMTTPSTGPSGFQSLGARLDFLDCFDYSCLVFFSADLVLRLAFCPKLSRFFGSLLNLADVVALLAGYAGLVVDKVLPEGKYTVSTGDLIQCLQIFRFLRFFRLLRDVIGFRVLVHSVKASTYELLLLVMFLSSGVLVFSTLVFWCERDNMGSIPEAFWWAIVTMTTVGYGDMVPKSFPGKVVGSLCAVSGVVLIAITIPVLVNNFLLFYGYSKVIQARQTGTTAKEEKQGRREAAHGVKERRGSGLSRVHVQPTDLDLDDVLKNETVKVKLPMQ